jgi:RNA polymerase sigma-70 factor (ECF subfamily)
MFFKKLFQQSQKDDASLIRQYKATGDLGVLGALYHRYMHLVFGVCMKYLKDEETAKDATMDIFEKLIVSLKQHEVQNFKSWLHVVAKNHCLMQLRATQRFSENGTSHDHTDMESDAFLHHNGEDTTEEQLVLIEKGLATLSGEQKECIELFYLQQKCYIEIAEITGYELKKVKSYIQNGKRNLKIFVQEYNEEKTGT